MIMVYVTYLVGKYAVHFSRKGSGWWWLDRGEEAVCKVVAEDQIGEVGEPIKGMVQDGTVVDEENINPKLRRKIRTWTSWISGTPTGGTLETLDSMAT